MFCFIFYNAARQRSPEPSSHAIPLPLCADFEGKLLRLAGHLCPSRGMRSSREGNNGFDEATGASCGPEAAGINPLETDAEINDSLAYVGDANGEQWLR